MTENSTKTTTNRYEKIMVAAREARRLNERNLMTRIEPKEKVTTEAIKRAMAGDIAFTYDKSETPIREDEGEDFLSTSDEA